VYTGCRQGNVREVHYSEHADLDGWIILKSVFKKHDEVSRGLDCSGSGQEQVDACCEHGFEPLGPIQYGVFLD
jgi:hypothetical protein